ncbi:unnamed protein product [Adineta ricciae]|uniref:Uncharacterized protein n=1 Tax=Adineta ricciae TaxID=249248 RepID=A0A814KT24_ADIRI|nr:unnamed protein product [Adineta ricciae]CAF1242264.1 unnamed protein product [Adineta ricciae]
MSTIHPSLIVLLDLEDEYKDFEKFFDSQLFRRYTNKDQCFHHISSRLNTSRLLHLFLPKSEHAIVETRLVTFNTIYYIYCIDKSSISAMQDLYNVPMFVKIFHKRSLSTYLQQAAISHLIEQAERAQHQPDERDMALQTAFELSNALTYELRQHMQEKINAFV